jgi:RHS repeat-associated protein
VHAGGIDQPVELLRMDAPIAFPAIPHANWRGVYDMLTTTGTRHAQCGPLIGYPLGAGAECFPFDLEPISSFKESAPRNRDNTDPGPRSWAGSLLIDGRDASGLLYRRNRYVDPASGRFTQEDPIGLAGGLNLYGFAAGDPVVYEDPFGLCPRHLRDAAGKCPGGLDENQYNEIKDGATLYLLGDAQTRILTMLDDGDIRRVRRTGNGRPAGAQWNGHDHIQVTSEFFGTSDIGMDTTEDRMWVLGHELGHIVQAERKALIYSPMERGIGAYLNQRKGRFYEAGQADANRYACEHTTGQGDWANLCQR